MPAKLTSINKIKSLRRIRDTSWDELKKKLIKIGTKSTLSLIQDQIKELSEKYFLQDEEIEQLKILLNFEREIKQNKKINLKEGVLR